MDTKRATSYISEDVNCVPRSHKISLGNPIRQNILNRSSATLVVSIPAKGIASGSQVAQSTTVRIYTCAHDR